MVSVVIEAGNDMEMEVGNDLSGRGAIGLMDVDSVGPEAILLCLGDAPDHRDDFGQHLIGGFGDEVVVGLGDDQGVAFHEGADIHERQNIRVFIHSDGWNFTGDNSTEDARIHGAGCSCGGV